MENSNLISTRNFKTVYDLKNNIAITKLATVVSQDKRHNPTLKLNVGMRCRINNIDNRTLNIIKQGQTLPFTNTVDTCTVVDNQECIVCDILFGNNNRPIIKKLSRRYFKASKSRNIIAIVAIVLTTVLFTTIFTLGSGLIDTVQDQNIRKAGGDGQVVLATSVTKFLMM